MMRVAQGVIYGVAILFLIAAVHADSPVENSPDHLVLNIDLGKTTFVLYEPVVIRYSVKNPTGVPVRGIVTMGAESGRIVFTIKQSNGLSVDYRPREIADVVQVERMIAPGAVNEGEVEIGWNAKSRGFAFPAVGKYAIGARMWVGMANGDAGIVSYELVAPSKEIDVVAPRSTDVSAIRALGSEERLRLLIKDGSVGFCRGEGDTDCVERLRVFVREHGDSAYAAGVTWDLASAVGSESLRPAGGREEAVDLYEMFLNHWPQHFDAPKAMYSLAGVYQSIGQDQKARDVMTRLEREYPSRGDLVERLKRRLPT